jgi:hypothetical protein
MAGFDVTRAPRGGGRVWRAETLARWALPAPRTLADRPNRASSSPNSAWSAIVGSPALLRVATSTGVAGTCETDIQTAALRNGAGDIPSATRASGIRKSRGNRRGSFARDDPRPAGAG